MSDATLPVSPAAPLPAADPRPVVDRRRLLASAVVASPLLIAINSSFHPEAEMNATSILAGAAADPTRWYVVHVVAAVGAMLAVPAAFGLRYLVHDRGRRLGTVGLVLATIGYPLLAMTFAAEASVMRIAAGLEPTAAVAAAEAYARTPEFYATGGAVLLGTLGSLLLGLAVLASRTAPRWLAALFVLATAATLAAAPGTPIGPIAFGLVTLASLGLAAHIWNARSTSG